MVIRSVFKIKFYSVVFCPLPLTSMQGIRVINLGLTGSSTLFHFTDYDMTFLSPGTRVLTFNTAAISQALPGCTRGNMINGVSADVREHGTVTLSQWGIGSTDFSPCFQTIYQCNVTSLDAQGGTTFFMV